MADWEAELASLLRALGVSLEHESRPSDGADGAHSVTLLGPTVTVDAGDSGEFAFDPQAEPGAPEPVDGDEVRAVRREIEATLARVVRLTRAGQLDPALRDDIVFVLRALIRPIPPTSGAAARDEWDLASAAAVLHFCRVVLRLTGRPPSDADG
jgi:hypothetical protein